MKKFLLGLFLILGVVSFAVPKYVDKAKLQKNSYEIMQDETDIFLFGKATEDVGLTVGFYNIKESNDMAKKISEEVKVGAPADQKFISSRENKRAYVNKFKSNDGNYTYSIVAKKTKVKNCYISILYVTTKDFKDNELDKVVDKTLNEVESYLK
ncbi:hypothetical protein [Fusobacterium hwasookii]|jgi:hypothetical protein|uniref:Uncharacterized protein n=3 Tax=Fusobacterium hwasookii TaxID=1583098 RepID=A0A0S2ZKY2_9FUSO|nr:hypothetical protein [Fusobacterium hwasookii]ALQ35025.1 hypothetical protein RN92_03550 [Fusobacterium hwasookii ChDC F206]ALQ38347.1 hypothetical protein RN97_09210 [Fusobacterium hwasookii ChDC F300]ALQ39579.1 hypothetical protein RN87_03170 [Fusobacterium hwasookii ChDC F174]EJU07082.1 hypothetical protein B437_08763 [Fusobacterium hwasookii ChDC F128]QNE68744.1 hypothetical protein H5V38_01900 [Fusobacterium hwasookii]